MHNFTPIPALLGGVLIGLAATLVLWFRGERAGVSGIFADVLVPATQRSPFRIAFVIGLIAVGAVAHAVSAETVTASPVPLPLVAIGGVLVGVGTRVGNGCTSGHGICGISQGSVRSIAATITFMAVGMAVVFALRAAHVIGVSP
jgi:uncharacterized protein